MAGIHHVYVLSVPQAMHNDTTSTISTGHHDSALPILTWSISVELIYIHLSKLIYRFVDSCIVCLKIILSLFYLFIYFILFLFFLFSV